MKIETQVSTANIALAKNIKRSGNNNIFDLIFEQVRDAEKTNDKQNNNIVQIPARKLIDFKNKMSETTQKEKVEKFLNQLLTNKKVSFTSSGGTELPQINNLDKLEQIVEKGKTINIDISATDLKDILNENDNINQKEINVNNVISKIDITATSKVESKSPSNGVKPQDNKEKKIMESPDVDINTNNGINKNKMNDTHKNDRIEKSNKEITSIDLNNKNTVQNADKKNDNNDDNQVQFNSKDKNNMVDGKQINATLMSDNSNIENTKNDALASAKTNTTQVQDSIEIPKKDIKKDNVIKAENTNVFDEIKKHRLDIQSLSNNMTSVSPENKNWQVVSSVSKDQKKLGDWIDSFKQEIDKLTDFKIENKQKVSMYLKEQDEQLRIVVEKKSSYISVEATVTEKMKDRLNLILGEVQNEMKDKGIIVKLDIKEQKSDFKNQENQQQGGNPNGKQRNKSNNK